MKLSAFSQALYHKYKSKVLKYFYFYATFLPYYISNSNTVFFTPLHLSEGLISCFSNYIFTPFLSSETTSLQNVVILNVCDKLKDEAILHRLEKFSYVLQ